MEFCCSQSSYVFLQRYHLGHHLHLFGHSHNNLSYFFCLFVQSFLSILNFSGDYWSQIKKRQTPLIKVIFSLWPVQPDPSENSNDLTELRWFRTKVLVTALYPCLSFWVYDLEQNLLVVCLLCGSSETFNFFGRERERTFSEEQTFYGLLKVIFKLFLSP